MFEWLRENLAKAGIHGVQAVGQAIDIPTEKLFWIIPGTKDHPRWILPHDSRYAKVIFEQWQPGQLVSRLKWKLLQVAYETKQLRWLPSIKLIAMELPPNNWQHVGCAYSAVPLIYVGTPSTTAKLVLMLISKDHLKPLHVIKIPTGSEAADSILREAAVLDYLSSNKPGLAPECLFKDKTTGIVTQEFINSKPTPWKLSERHIEWLFKCRIPYEIVNIQEEIQVLKNRIQNLDLADSPALKTVCAWIDENIDSHQLLQAVISHGDFSPWNVRQLENGQYFLIDWEEATLKGLPLLDLIHYSYIQSYTNTRYSWDPDKWLTSPLVKKYLEAFAISPEASRQLIHFYLVEKWIRWHEQKNPLEAERWYDHMKPYMDG